MSREGSCRVIDGYSILSAINGAFKKIHMMGFRYSMVLC